MKSLALAFGVVVVGGSTYSLTANSRFIMDAEVSSTSTALIRLILVIPVLIVLGLLSSVRALLFPALLLTLFQQKCPKWWFDWNVELTKFSLQVISYGLLMRDEYPSTDEEQSV